MRRLLLAVSTVVALLLALAGCKVTMDDGSTVTVPNCVLPTVAPTAVTSGSCTWTASPAPTTTPSSTTSTTKPTSTTPTTSTTTTAPPAVGFPVPATTGAPAGQTFQPLHQGDLTITAPGTYSGLHVAGAVHVKVGGVTITNSWIDGTGVTSDEVITNDAPADGRLAVTNTTIGNPTACNGQPGLGEHDYTADHVKIVGMGDGFRVSGSDVTIQNSYVQTCDHVSNHDDALQIYCPAPLPQPCQNILVSHNTLSVAGVRNFTAPLFGGSDPGGPNGQLANSKFLGNLLWGGVFTVDLAGTGLDIEHNRIVTNRWTMPDGAACEPNSTGVMTASGCSYAGWVWGSSAVAQSGSTCTRQNVTWSDNTAVAIDSSWQPLTTVKALACV